MKKAFFTVVLLTLAVSIFAQQTRKAEVEVSYMIAGFIDVQTVTVDAKDVRDAEIQAYNLYQMFSTVLEVNFLRWLPAEKPAPQQQTQQPKAQQQQPQAQPQQQQQPARQQPAPAPSPAPQSTSAPAGFAPYIGTWVWKGGAFDLFDTITVTFTNNGFSYKSNKDSFFQTIGSWSAMSSGKNRDFPSGYILSGPHRNGYGTYSVHVYMHNNGRSLDMSLLGEFTGRIFTKQ